MSEEEKEVLKTFKSGLGLTGAEQEILANYIDKLQKENKESKELYDKLFNGYNKLVQEHLELEKTIDLIIDDFQMENYFVGMTNKEVQEYYKKRKELEE